MAKIGFMQGRLSPQVDGKIQAFPWDHWREEFIRAHQHGFPIMEWTIDRDRIFENPLMTTSGRREIQSLSKEYGLNVQSLTGDNFMQAPFYKAEGQLRKTLVDEMKALLDSCAELKMKYALIPLVDRGGIENPEQEEVLLKELLDLVPFLKSASLKVLFESDFPPARLVQFMKKFPKEAFGINYDIGNSAALGFDPTEEITAYADRIDNVHVKDRVLGGTTVPLGTGNADLPRVFRELAKVRYAGDYILQTARAADGNHDGVLKKYRDRVKELIDARGES